MQNKIISSENTDDIFLPQNVDGVPLRTIEVSDNREEQKKKVRLFKRNRSFSLIDVGFEASHQSLPETDLPSESVSEYRATQRLLTTASGVKTKASKASLRLRKLNTMLSEAVKYHSVGDIERIIKAGASPNCTCGEESISACHLAAMRSDEALSILIKYGAAKMIPDRIGRTPLHLAAWAGNVKQVAIILGLSKDLQNRVSSDKINNETIEEIERHRDEVSILVNVRCQLSDNMKLLKDWKKNSIDDKCKDYEKNLPMFQVGWTPLHAACVRAQARCVQLLLAAGADPCAHDVIGRTPLDIVGLSCHTDPSSIKPDEFAEVVSMFVELNCYNLTIKNRKTFGSPLHIAVLIGSLDAVKVLVEAKMPVNWLDRDGLTPLHLCVKKKFREHLQILANFGYTDDGKIGNVIDVRDKDCHTILHKAINENWLPGVCVALEAGANVTAKDISGETPIHYAAFRGNVEILKEVLKFVQNKYILDTPNKSNETPLFKAVLHGHVECVKRILEEGASIEVTRPSGVNIFHTAAMAGNIDVLSIVLDHNYTLTRAMINYLSFDGAGYGPIHFAVENNFLGCVKLLLSRNAYANLKTSQGHFKGSTPMHIAAMKNNVKIAKILLKHERQSVCESNNLGWTPLHTASYYGSRDMIMFLIEHGADLSASTKGSNSNHNSTVIHFIMNNLSKPTEFMENILDRCISTDNLHYHDKDYKVNVNYRILLPGPEETKHMTIMQALVKTGNRHGQRRLLVHPVVESFLHLKWKTLLPFFYVMLVFHCLFVISLTSYVLTVLFYKDNDTAVVPSAINTTAWTAILYLSIFLIITQELLYIKVDRRYFMELETWIKFSSIIIAAILPPLKTTMNEDNKTKNDKTEIEDNVQWPRHLASLALLLSWLHMMFLMSRMPKWGYYVLMFGKVSSNVIKILLTFVFLLIGFSMSFMVEFHSQKPFEDPLAAFVKIIVMLTSEFDYNDMKTDKNTSSILVVRFILIAFIILSTIVLMNLMVGVAVYDLQNLQLLGNITRLAKQVEYLESIENLLYNNRVFGKILPGKIGEMLKFKTISSITLHPGDPSAKCNKVLPNSLRELILEKALINSKRIEAEKGSQSFKKKLEEIHEVTVNKIQQNKTVNDNEVRKQLEEMAKRIAELNDAVEHERSQSKSSINEMQYCIQELHSKIDSIVDKLENISSKL